ncbi:hypothetical protein BU23DRAFT_573708 [Bimuria novae-zelandiae CBS 107.79]|uniref:Uncharacterized protein n=1 Tax=Bimuria novae-zelandiae CBS 107.79 TaxID=1447943 RepID=A0A6A5UPZ0_9PLEO|nr:hypothetical protein BU23DRAFT_573708 [Bimuria novae-zelandiae CBS 107.79]
MKEEKSGEARISNSCIQSRWGRATCTRSYYRSGRHLWNFQCRVRQELVRLDYEKMDLLGWVSADRAAGGFDVVFDCNVGDSSLMLGNVEEKKGKVISVAEAPDPIRPGDGLAEGLQGVSFIAKADEVQLGDTADSLEWGKCNAVIDGVLSLRSSK